MTSTQPIPTPTKGALVKYWMPSKRPAAVAAALRPPKSIDAAPPIMPCAPLTKNERQASTATVIQGPPGAWKRPMITRSTAIPTKPTVMTGPRRLPKTLSEVIPKAKPPAMPSRAMPQAAAWYGP